MAAIDSKRLDEYDRDAKAITRVLEFYTIDDLTLDQRQRVDHLVMAVPDLIAEIRRLRAEESEQT